VQTGSEVNLAHDAVLKRDTRREIWQRLHGCDTNTISHWGAVGA